MEKNRRVEEERDQLKALNIQLQDQVSLHIKSTFIMSKHLVKRGQMLR